LNIFTHAFGLDSESDPSNIASAVFGQIKFFIPDSYGANGNSITLQVDVSATPGLLTVDESSYAIYLSLVRR